MDKKIAGTLLQEQVVILEAAVRVLSDSRERVEKIFMQGREELSVGEKESCEALTARFARLCDFLFQRAFRTLDKIELLDEGTGIDRLNRAEKRGIITSAELWKELRDLRNSIAHEYLIEKSDRVLKEALRHSAELLETAQRFKEYVTQKNHL